MNAVTVVIKLVELVFEEDFTELQAVSKSRLIEIQIIPNSWLRKFIFMTNS